MNETTPAFAWASLLPGFASGLVRVTVSYPFDFVRTRQQALNTPLTTTLRSVKWSGVFGGYWIAALGVSTERAVQFALMEHGLAAGYDKVVLGAAAGFFSACFGTCYQTVLSRRIVFGNSVRDASRHIFTRLTAFSAAPEFGRSWLGSTIYLSTYVRLRELNTMNGTWAPAVNGVLASWAAITATYPLETLRVRMQTTSSLMAMAMGLPSFYKGLPLALLRTVPSASLGMFVYESLQSNT